MHKEHSTMGSNLNSSIQIVLITVMLIIYESKFSHMFLLEYFFSKSFSPSLSLSLVLSRTVKIWNHPPPQPNIWAFILSVSKTDGEGSSHEDLAFGISLPSSLSEWELWLFAMNTACLLTKYLWH